MNYYMRVVVNYIISGKCSTKTITTQAQFQMFHCSELVVTDVGGDRYAD